jgi:hypothetical protein
MYTRHICAIGPLSAYIFIRSHRSSKVFARVQSIVRSDLGPAGEPMFDIAYLASEEERRFSDAFCTDS